MQKKAGLLITLATDAVMATLAYFFTLGIRNHQFVSEKIGQLHPSVIYPAVPLTALFILFFIFSYQGLYSSKYHTKVKELFLLGLSHTKLLVVLMALAYLSKYDFSRFILLVFVPLSFVFILLGRAFTRMIKGHLLSKNIGLVSVVVVGRGKKARELEKELGRHYGSRMKLLAAIEPVLGENGMEIPLEKLKSTISSRGFVQVYIAEPQLSHEKILSTMAECSFPRVEFKVVADIFTLATGSFAISNIEEIPTLDMGKSQPNIVYRVVKRLIDILGALAGIIISSPLWLAIAVAIKMETKGPVVISQKRVGYRGKEFTLWKFRTMHASAPLYDHPPKGSEDKRITRVGAWLRKTSLDELPQLLNVLIGTMSLVGPRPEMAFIVNGYTAWQRKRLEAKPGLTGLWQVLGRKDIPLTENLHYDFYYINNQSLLLDIVILLKTIPVVLFGKGAY